MASSSNPSSPPSLRARVAIALGIALFASSAAWVASHRPNFGIPDFHSWWLAADALLKGDNPYHVVARELGEGFYFFNPLPAAVATVPFALLRPDYALAAFTGVSTAILAFVVTRKSYDPLVMFLSASFIHTAVMGQWSMLLTAALFAPSLSFLGAVKPNIGAAIVASLASWRAALAMLLFGLATLVIMPSWPTHWLESIRGSTWHFAPIAVPGGIVLLAALLRWRRPEARLIAAMALVPQSPFVYEAMPLFAVPRSRPEFYALVIGSDVGLAVYAMNRGMEQSSFLYFNGLAVAAAMYLPALIMVLRRPNVGHVGAIAERAAARMPRWLSGQPS